MIDFYGSQIYSAQSNGKMGYDIVSLPFYGKVNLCNGTEFRVYVAQNPKKFDSLFVGIEGRGCYTFSGYSHPTYVAEKLNISGVDSLAMSDFICGQFDIHEQHQEDLRQLRRK